MTWRILIALALAFSLASVAEAQGIRGTISWVDNSDNEDGFRVERKEGVAGTFAPIATLPVDAVSYVDEPLNPNTEYCYRIVAFNAVGEGVSPEACATTPAVPVAPSSVQIIITIVP
jgi:hypothetical protein